MAMLNVGDDAPAFSLQNQDGANVSLEQFRGKNVVLWWYPKADTPG
jgi:peroxiredoxin Q/BCP